MSSQPNRVVLKHPSRLFLKLENKYGFPVPIGAVLKRGSPDDLIMKFGLGDGDPSCIGDHIKPEWEYRGWWRKLPGMPER